MCNINVYNYNVYECDVMCVMYDVMIIIIMI